MKTIRYFTARALNAGTFTGTKLDTLVDVDPLYQHPAVTPSQSTNPSTLYTGVQLDTGSLSGTASGTWTTLGTVVYSSNYGDYIQFQVAPPNAYVSVRGTGIVSMNMGETVGDAGWTMATIRNGANLGVYVDGVLTAALDCFGGTPFWDHLFTDGATHTIKVQHLGTYDSNVHPVSALTNTSGTSFAATALTPTPPASFVAAKWRLLATSTSQYSLYKTPVGGSESLIASGLAAGSVDSTNVPGVHYQTPATLVNTDQAVFYTDATMVGLLEVGIATSSGSPSGSYTSAIADAGDPLTDWAILRWVQNVPVASVAAAVSNSLVATVINGVATHNLNIRDPAYATITVTPLNATLPSGLVMGIVGLLGMGQARFCQWTITLASGAVVTPFFREPILYYRDSAERAAFLDTIAFTNLAIRQFGPNALAYLTALEVLTTDYSDAKSDLRAAYAVSGATGQYLAAYGAALGLPQYTGEPPESYQARIITGYNNKPRGGSIGYICAQVAQVVQGSPQAISPPSYAGGLASVSGGGVTVSQTSGRGFSVVLPAPAPAPAPAYPGLPGMSTVAAQQLISDYIVGKLRPVGSAVSITF